MSDKIDQRIVEMSFENHKFEKGILESKNSLKDFSKALDNMGTGKEFNGLDRSVQSISFSFSALEQIGIGALRRIGEAAINAGTNMFKSLAIDPIAQGFGEMELKMNSTQTIMASTGETLAVVNGYLQELNEYSDKTIYSFSDMTQNIGKFTNAGVKLETAVASIKGISNAAALAGANSQEASRAMYNFAQALSAGYVKLVDWKSIELANMATVEFKQQLLDAAVAAGTVTKTADGMYRVLTTDMGGKAMERAISATRNFNESLSFQWMTTDTLTRTLSDYADETTEIGKRASQAATQVTTFTKLMETLRESVGSGWAQTFEIIFGDFNEARSLWTGMNDALGGMINTLSDTRNALLSGGLGSGWKQFLKEGISDATTFGDTLAAVAGEAGIDIDNLVKSSGSMEKAVKGTWVTGGMLIETVSRMASSIEGLSDEELKNVGHTAKTKSELLALRDALKSGSISADDFATKMGQLSGRENVIQGFKSAVVALLTAIKPISKAFDQIFPPTTVERLYSITQMFKNFTERLIISGETADKIQRTFAGLFAVVDTGLTTVKFLGSAFLEIAQIFIPISGGFLDVTATAGDFLVVVNHIIKSSGAFQYGLLAIKIAALIARNAIVDVIETISEFATGLWNADRPLEYIGSLVQKIFGGILDTIKMGVNWISTKFVNSLSKVSKFLGGMVGDDQSTILSSFLSIFKEFVDLIINKATGGLKDFGSAIKDIDFSRIATFATGGVLLLFISQLTKLTGAMTNVLNTSNSFMTQLSKKIFGSTTKIKDLAIAFGILSASLYVLSTIPYDDLNKGLVGLAKATGLFVAAYAGIQTINVVATKVLGDKQMIKSAFNLVGIASGLAIMAGALKIISGIDPTIVSQSVGILGAMMGFLIAYQSLYAVISTIPGQGKLPSSLIGMSLGLLGMIGVVKVINGLTNVELDSAIDRIITVLTMMGTIQVLFSLAARLTGGNQLTTGMLGMAGGILAILGVMKILNGIDLNALSKGIENLFSIGLIFAGLEVIFGLAARLSGGKKFKSNILSISVGMLAMVGLITIIDMLEQAQIDKGINVLMKMGGIIAGIELITAASARIAGGNKTQKILGAMTLTLLSFTGVIAVLGVLPTEVIDQGIATLMKMVGLIAAIELVTAMASRVSTIMDKDGNAVKGASMFASLIGVTLAIIALTGALALLSMIDQESLRQASVSLGIATVAIGVMSLGLGVMLKSLSAMSTNLSGLKGIMQTLLTGFVVLGTVLIGTIALLGAIKMVSPMLQSIQWEDIGKFTVGMGLVSTLILAFTKLTNNGSTNWQAGLQSLIPGFAAVTGVIIATAGFFKTLGWVLPIVNAISWDDLGKFTVGLGIVGIMVAGMALLTPAFTALGGGFVAALGGVLTAIAGVALVVAAFVGLSVILEKLFGKSDVLLKGIEKLILVGEGIGKFVGGLIGGFNGEVLKQTGEGLASFSESIGRIKAVSFDGVKGLGNAVTLANDIKKFVKTLSGVDFTIVEPATQALEKINKSFTTVGATILESALKSFENNRTPFQTAIVDFLNTTIKTVDEKGEVISTSFADLFKNAIQKSRTNIDSFRQLGADLVIGMKNGIVSEQQTAIDAISGVSKSVIEESRRVLKTHSPSKVFEEIGGWLPISLGNGIKRNSKSAILAGINMSQDVEDSIRDTLDIHSESDTFNDIGSWVPKSISSGIQNGKSNLVNKAKELGIDTSNLTVEGITEGLAGGEGAVTTGITSLLDLLQGNTSIKEIGNSLGSSLGGALGAQTGNSFSGAYANSLNGPATKAAYKDISKDAFELFKEAIDHRKEYNLISLGEELAEWENFSKKYVAGTDIRMKADKEIARVRTELQSKEFDNSKRWIEEEKYYKRLSLVEELAAWERVQARYEEGHAYRMEAERELFRIKQEIQQAEYDNSVSWIEDEKYYKRLSLQDELAAWTVIQKKYERGSDYRKKADKEVFRLEEEIAEKRKSLEDDYYAKTKEINDKLKQDIDNLEKAYVDAVDSRAKSLYDSYKLFDAVEIKDPIDGEQLLTNLGDQVAAFETWQKRLTELGARGISEGLMTELEAMGPSSSAEIQALNSLTDEQLTQYVNLWQQKHQAAKDQATLELEQMRVNTTTQIQALQAEAATQLEILKQTFDNGMAEVSRVTNAQVKTMRSKMDAEVTNLVLDTTNNFEQMGDNIKNMDWFDVGETMMTGIKSGIVSQAEALANALNSAITGASVAAPSISTTGNATANKIDRKAFAEKYQNEIAAASKKYGVDLGVAQAMLENEMRKNGEESIQGMRDGIQSKTADLTKTAVTTVTKAFNAVKTVLGIHSPSTKFFGLGVFSMKGFVNGLDSLMSSVKGSGERLANMAVNSLVPAVSQISTLLDDTDLTIRPVLDLSNIQDGSRKIGELLGNRSISLSEIANKTSSLVSKPVLDDTNASIRDNQSKSEASYSFVQNNYSPKPLSRIEIYRQTKNQFSTLKGLVKN